MKHDFFHILLVLSILSASCRELVQDEFPDFENKVTVNTIIKSNSPIKLHLSLTDELNSTPLSNIQNAEITLTTQSAETIDFEHVAEGVYSSDYIAKETDTFNLSINVPDKENISADCYIPQSDEIIDAVVSENTWVNSESELSPSIYFKIKNNKNQLLYYEALITVFSAYQTTQHKKYNLEDEYIIQLFDNSTEKNDFIEKNIKFQYYKSSNIKKKYFYLLTLRFVDSNYYKYAKSLKAYDESRNPIFSGSSIIPTSLYSNVKNGYGIMCAYSQIISDTLKDNNKH